MHRFARVLAFAAAMLCAVAACAQQLDAGEARHLLVRTGFGAEPPAIAALVGVERGAAVDRMLAKTRRDASLAPPRFLSEAWPAYRDLPSMDQEQRDAFIQARRGELQELKTWWLMEMIATPSPLTERMTLFWHNHFVSAFEGAGNNVHRMWNQNALFRRESTGNFAALLRAILADPAMLRYLDAATNRKGRPNENLARELLELFTLGEGNYGEQDIREIARALTGLGVDRATNWDFRFYPGQHEAGPKRFLGTVGDDAEGVVRAILAQQRTAEFVVEKLWREFVSPRPDPAEVMRIAAVLRGSAYDIASALRALLVSDAFWDRRNRGTLIKSPAVLIAGIHRDLGLPLVDPSALAVHTRKLGQDLFEPPNVKGWPGGEAWITPASLVARSDVLSRLLDNRGLVGPAPPVGASTIALRVAGDAWQTNPLMRVTLGDGTVVAQREIEFARDTARFGVFGDRDDRNWRILRFPVDRPVELLVVSFVNDGAAPMPPGGGPRGDRNLYVDWLEVDGRIYPAAAAVQTYRSAGCRVARAGDLFCNGDLVFDIARMRAAPQTMDMAMAGGGMAPAPMRGVRPALADRPVHLEAAGWIATLPQAWRVPRERWRALAPLAPVAATPEGDDESFLRALVLDPVYQLM
ncbi:MAG: DUF1800 family protein [Rhodospirillales bacterium]|jgi:uncharacterized protein (DUF1800 family)